VDDLDFQLWQGDALEVLRGLPSGSVHCALTSPPFYSLRDYGCEGQIGLEASVDEWCANLVGVFRELRRVLRDDGTFWCEIGDGFANKHLIGAPWLLAFALRADGWYLRSEIIWDKPNPMPESVTDRPTKSHSTVFLLAKSPRYFFDQEAVREDALWPNGPNSPESIASPYGQGFTAGRSNGTPPAAGRNVRSVWRIATQPTPFAHFATWPEKLVERMILAGTSERGCCPECGAPWEREVERTIFAEQSIAPKSKTLDGMKRNDGDRNLGGQQFNKFKAANPDRFIGWRPTCAHDLEPIPATILDCFMGSGTSALVARRLGRRSVGIELSREYAELCARRLQQQSLFA
jgi:DNA modification methylase